MGALRLLGRMQSQSIVPNVISYSASISACEKGHQWQEALRLLGRMQSQSIVPDVISYSASISACEKGEQWQVALRLLALLCQQGVIYTSSGLLSCSVANTLLSCCPTRICF